MSKLLSLKDFLDMPDRNINETAHDFQAVIKQMDELKANPFCLKTVAIDGVNVKIQDPYTSQVIDAIGFVSNSYLGLNHHPKVIKVSSEAVLKYGVGLCAAPPIGGDTWLHSKLRNTISKLHNMDDTILYSSGYAANVGVYQVLLNKSDLAIVDMYVHASIYDGLKNNTNIKICRHNDMDYLEMVLKREQGKYRNMVVVIDGVYSQDGDLAPLPQICHLAKKYGAMIFVDDAHGVGVFGKNGKGTCNHFEVEEQVDLITGTFSKSIGTSGGYATGSKELIKYLRHSSRSNTFSVSIPLFIAEAAIKAIELFQEEPELIEKLWNNTKYAKNKFKSNGFDIGESKSPITPIMIRDDRKALLVARELLHRGIYVIPAIYPAVKSGNSRFRIGITAGHSTKDIDKLCNALLDINNTFNFVY